jgi:hypothetical protein
MKILPKGILKIKGNLPRKISLWNSIEKRAVSLSETALKEDFE